jgi:acyl-CoA oxidase
MTEMLDRPATGEAPGTALTAALRAVVDGDQAGVRDRMRTLLSGEAFAYPEPEISIADYRELVLARTRALADAGVGVRRAEDAHGRDANVAARIAEFKTIGLGDLSLMVKVGVQFGLFGGAIHRLGTEVHHERYLADIASLALPGCFAMSETGHGSDVKGLRTTATYDPDTQEFVVHTPDEQARKDWIGNAAAHGRAAVVFAQLETLGEAQGVHAVVVPIRDESGRPMPGVTITDCGPKMGLNGVDNGRLVFDQVRVPRDALLDRYGQVAADGTYSSSIDSPGRRFFTTIGALVEGRIAVAAQAISVTEVGLTIAVRYALRRRQFPTADGTEQLLMDYTTHQRRLLPAIATTYGLELAHADLVRRYAANLAAPTDAEQRTVEALAAGVKAYATWHNTAALEAARQCCGGKGYLFENRFATLLADSDVFQTFEGDNTVLAQLVVKGLLSGHAADFEDLDLVGLVKQIAGRAFDRLDPRRGDDDALESPDGQLAAFQWREEHLVETLGRRMKFLLTDGVDPAEALNRCMDHGLAAFRAHLDRVVLESYVQADGPAMLSQLRDLFALSVLEGDRAYWLEHGYLSAAQCRSLPGRVDVLCQQLRPYADTLVGGFGVPDALLAAPIATRM